LRALVSVAVAFHLAAILAGALGVPPSSALQREIADRFVPYFDLTNLGHSYRFYTEPPPTPVVTATLRFGNGLPDQEVRLPARDLSGPWMRHQRQLALANALFRDVLELKEQSMPAKTGALARSYARHLCRTRPDCESVTLHLQQHLIPDPETVLHTISSAGQAEYDLFDERLFTTPEWIGDFPCDAF
jgi:hypothetical protein